MPITSLGKYKLHEELGRGGFGIVYRATDTVLGRAVALKILHPQLTVDADFIERFRNEARRIAAFDHPNIATVYDMGEENGRVFIAMRYLPGGSLRDKLKPEGAIPFDQALQIVKEVSAGLKVAHAKGLIHRDIKPENILFTEDGQAVISDFGLAKAIQASALSTSSSLGGVGTPAYRAPELWRGKPPASPATDEYSLACVFTEMLTGRQLFDGDTPDEIITKHLVDGAVIPAKWPEGIPHGIGKILGKALDKNPEKRYQQVIVFVDALEGLLDGKAAPTSHIPRPAARPTEASRDDLKPKSRARVSKRPHRVVSPPSPPGTVWRGWLVLLGGATLLAVVLLFAVCLAGPAIGSVFAVLSATQAPPPAATQAPAGTHAPASTPLIPTSTITSSMTVSLPGQLSDGELINQNCHDVWERCRGASEGTDYFQGYPGATIESSGGSSPSSGYLIKRIFMLIDESGIATNAIVTGAELHIYAGAFLDGNKTIHIVHSSAESPLSPTSFGSIEFISGGSTTLSGPLMWATITLNDTGLSWIKPGNTLSVALIHDYDLRNIAPDSGNKVLIATSEDEQHRPYLIVTYSKP